MAPHSVFPFHSSALSKYFNFLFATQGPDYFLGDPNTPLPGPYREPIRFRYFAHTPDCSNKISPNDLVDKYERPLNVRACPHCSGLLRRGESEPNTWCTPMHWDLETQEVFGGRPVPKSSRTAYRETLKWVKGDWADPWVVPELKYWSTNQESHALDQNYFEPARMQGAMRNNFCISRVLPDEANTPSIARSYIDDKDKKYTKPIRVCVMDVDPGDRALEEGIDESDTRNTKHFNYCLEPWKLMPLVFENGGDAFRVWWCSIGKAKVTTDTARIREEYEASQPMDARLVQLGDAVLSPEDRRVLQAEWNKILKEEHGLPELKLGTRETRAISMTRQTTKGRRTRQVSQERMSSVAHNLASSVKVNTLIQREIRENRRRDREAKYASVPEDEIPLLNRYVDQKSSSDADTLCRGGCFALVELHHLELKRLADYSATADEVFAALETEQRRSVRNATKYERKTARKSNLGQEELQERIDRRRARIEIAYEQAAVFRRGHCTEHAA